MNIGRFSQFSEPVRQVQELPERSGVYVILTQSRQNPGMLDVLDIGESGGIQSRIQNHDRKEQWSRFAEQREIVCSYGLFDERNRMLVEAELRKQFNPPCGER